MKGGIWLYIYCCNTLVESLLPGDFDLFMFYKYFTTVSKLPKYSIMHIYTHKFESLEFIEPCLYLHYCLLWFCSLGLTNRHCMYTWSHMLYTTSSNNFRTWKINTFRNDNKIKMFLKHKWMLGIIYMNLCMFQNFLLNCFWIKSFTLSTTRNINI